MKHLSFKTSKVFKFSKIQALLKDVMSGFGKNGTEEFLYFLNWVNKLS